MQTAYANLTQVLRPCAFENPAWRAICSKRHP